MAPQAQDFYCNWARAYIELAKGNVAGTQNLYKKAFEARRFAGRYFELFIKQAFALAVYADSNPNTVRESIDPAKNSTSPLPKEAKKYWNYGYAVGIFDKSTEDTHLEYFNRFKNFYSVFSGDMFFEHGKKKVNAMTNFLNSMGIDVIKGDFETNVEKDYQRLCALTSQTINHRVRMFDSENQHKISPISLALYHASQFSDRRFIELLKDWLGLSDGKLKFDAIDVNIVSDAGVTPVSAAIVQYKLLRLKENLLDKKALQNMKDFKQIALKLIKMTSREYLNVESKKTFRHPLQEAIESYDIELVRAIIERGLDINGLTISADACSPVYYTLLRIKALQNPSRTIANMKTETSLSNMNWDKLNVPGMTTADKKNSELGTDTQEMFDKMSLYQIFGNPETYETQLKELKNVCLYLIGKTANQDEFILRNKFTNESWTSLYYAVETDDADICRKLIEKGANPNLYLPMANESSIPNTFLYRCIEFKAWKVLEMYLTEYADVAKVIEIHLSRLP